MGGLPRVHGISVRLIVSIHDVAPHHEYAVREWRQVVARQVAGPVSLLVVPCYAGVGWWPETDTLAWVQRQAAIRDEIVAHGFTHTDVNGDDGREFAHREPDEVRRRVRASVWELTRLGLPVRGFISPAYAHPRTVTSACQDVGLSWWATRMRLAWSGAARWLPSISLGASTPLRRRWSPSFAIAAAHAAAHTEVVRLDLHPADLDYPQLDATGRRLLQILVEQGRTLATHAEFIGGDPSRQPLQVNSSGPTTKARSAALSSVPIAAASVPMPIRLLKENSLLNHNSYNVE